MDGFTSRRETFESRFAHDEALRFKAIARRNKLFGLWAARQLRKSSSEAEVYAASVVMADFVEPGDNDVIGKVVTDLIAEGVPVEEGQVRRVLDDLMVRATDEIKAGM